MSTFIFDDDKAAAACARYVEEGTPLLRAERQRDADGFLNLLRSAAGQEKLRVKESAQMCEPPTPIPPLAEDDFRDA
jgi:hypothetical protein